MMKHLLKQHPRVEALARKLISIYPLSARLGSPFWNWYAFLEESETWSPSQLLEYQFQQLRTLLQHLAKNSPFYAKRMGDLKIETVRSLADLQSALPPVSRKEFAANFHDIQSREFRQKECYSSATSGTTGSPLQFFHRKENRMREWAAICHQWKRVGYDPVRSRRAEFRGLTRQGSLFQDFPEQNMVRMSILALRAENLPRMAEVIRSRQVDFFHGYPSAIYLLAQTVQRSGIRFPQPKSILLASEMVYDFQLEQIQAAFPSSKLFAHYGCAECTVLGAWCEHRRVYHILPQYSIVEADASNGEILGTNLYNDVNGFVRYRMTDAAGGVEISPCSACQRPYVPIVTGLDGRQEDYLYSPEIGWIAPAIVTYPLKHLHNITELQFVQESPSSLILNYSLRPGATADMVTKELDEIETGLRGLIGNSIALTTIQVDEIPRGPTGKFKWIVSRLDPASIGCDLKRQK